jgi:hypothetical protein
MNKLMVLSIPVGYHSAGNTILNKMIPFQIYRDGYAFIAAPLISPQERRLADLPQEMSFEYTNTIIASSRGKAERKMDVLKDILQKMTLKGII